MLRFIQMNAYIILCLDLNGTTYLSSTINEGAGGSDSKASAYNATVGDLSSVPVSGRSSGEGNGNPLQYSCLENPMDGGTW